MLHLFLYVAAPLMISFPGDNVQNMLWFCISVSAFILIQKEDIHLKSHPKVAAGEEGRAKLRK